MKSSYHTPRGWYHPDHDAPDEKPISAKLRQAIKQAMKDEEVHDGFHRHGSNTTPALLGCDTWDRLLKLSEPWLFSSVTQRRSPDSATVKSRIIQCAALCCSSNWESSGTMPTVGKAIIHNYNKLKISKRGFFISLNIHLFQQCQVSSELIWIPFFSSPLLRYNIIYCKIQRSVMSSRFTHVVAHYQSNISFYGGIKYSII